MGDASDLWLPVTRKDLSWWQSFLANHFNLFGDYEDAIEPSSDFLFHSAISPLLNIGLLTPQQVINDVLSLSDQIPLNSLGRVYSPSHRLAMSLFVVFMSITMMINKPPTF